MDTKPPRPPYPSDLTDAQWHLLEPLLPPPPGGGRHRTTDLREVVNAILYVDKNGCAWRPCPTTSPAKGPSAHYFHRLAARRRLGTDPRHLAPAGAAGTRAGQRSRPPPSSIASRSRAAAPVACAATTRARRSRGRSGTCWSIPWGCCCAWWSTPPTSRIATGPSWSSPGRSGSAPEVRLVWADGGYAGKLIAWLRQFCGWVLEIVKRNELVKGWQLLPRRWVVERTISLAQWVSAAEPRLRILAARRARRSSRSR